MAMKTRVLYLSNKGKMISFADAICGKIESKADVIPPAYSCDRERIVYIGVTLGKDLPNGLRLFCAGLNKNCAQNVALFVDGTPESANALANVLREAGTNVMSEILYVKGGAPFKFLKTITAEEKKTVEDWAQKLYSQISAN